MLRWLPDHAAVARAELLKHPEPFGDDEDVWRDLLHDLYRSFEANPPPSSARTADDPPAPPAVLLEPSAPDLVLWLPADWSAARRFEPHRLDLSGHGVPIFVSGRGFGTLELLASYVDLLHQRTGYAHADLLGYVLLGKPAPEEFRPILARRTTRGLAVAILQPVTQENLRQELGPDVVGKRGLTDLKEDLVGHLKAEVESQHPDWSQEAVWQTLCQGLPDEHREPDSIRKQHERRRRSS